MRTLQISISELEYRKFDIKEERLHFSRLLDIISREITKIGLQQAAELSEKCGPSVATMDDISAGVKAMGDEKRNY